MLRRLPVAASCNAFTSEAQPLRHDANPLVTQDAFECMYNLIYSCAQQELLGFQPSWSNFQGCPRGFAKLSSAKLEQQLSHLDFALLCTGHARLFAQMTDPALERVVACQCENGGGSLDSWSCKEHDANDGQVLEKYR